ncbi:MAG: hypothetical protein H0U74_10465 [Bradymonadaceae bacterium]|nr:hypothetical protein [Lujinxingiaceae bacterium]
MGLGHSGLRLSGILLTGVAAAGLVVACNTHPAEFARSTGAIEVLVTTTLDASPKLDILWMIDNSGSMCQEQKGLRDNFESFIEILGEIDLDFHIGVTTTHMLTREEYLFEPVALPGHLQSTPQPIPGYDPSCYYAVNADGTLDHSSLEPVLDAIRTAVSCTRNPASHSALLNPNINELRCALDDARWGCAPADIKPRSDFFPRPADYRDIPKFLESSKFRDAAGRLDIARLQGDFACISMVGTLGYGIEKGLGAIVRAVNVDLTGGPDGDPATHPNAGFLRPDARTGIIIVTDENDCTHDGGVNERTSCGVAECTFRENDPNSPLVPIETLKKNLLENLASSKGLSTVSPNDVLVASIHGDDQRYKEARPAECEAGWNIPISCASTKGVAYSGHRYGAFVSSFPQYFPKSTDTNGNPEGLICGDFGPALQEIANLFKVEGGGCVNNIYRCEEAGSYCPPFPHSGDEGTCTAYPNGGGRYCNSGVQVRLRSSDDDSVQRLTDTGFCEPGSINTVEFKGGCVVSTSQYRWDGCPGGGAGLKLVWTDDQFQNILSGLEIQIRYAQLPVEAL